MKIIVCVPGQQFSASFLRCWTDLMESASALGHHLNLRLCYSSNIYYVRNMLLGGVNLITGEYEPFKGEDYDYSFWIDSDTVFRPADFWALLAHERDIVTGITMVNEQQTNIAMTTGDKIEDYLHLNTGDLINYGKSLFRCKYCGFSFAAVKKGVFEEIQYPWFRPYFMEMLPNVSDICGEDTGFCISARQCGYDIFVDPKVRLGHEKVRVLQCR